MPDNAPRQLQAVMFDMDGLLVDSEPLWYPAEVQVFRRLGAQREWTHADAGALVGNALQRSAEVMITEAGASIDPATVVGWFVEAMALTLTENVPWKPGALALLEELASANIPTALVSMSWRKIVDPVLDALPAGSFASSVAGDEVTMGKPHPEPYLRACALLGVDPALTVVLEDSPTGAASGHAAGCIVVQVPDLVGVPVGAPWVERDSLKQLGVESLTALLNAQPTSTR